MFEILEHTADIGFRARARTLPELMETAALALESIALETSTIEPSHEYPLEATGEDAEALLVNWLSEVLYWIDGEQLAFHHFTVREITAGRVAGCGVGERRDPERHPAKLIVKAVTYHQLRLAETPQGWEAEVYLDI
jgi:SHS2 domain-containing protein